MRPYHTMTSLFTLAALALGVSAGAAFADDKPATLKVAGAANMSAALGEIGPAFEKATGSKVVFSFGASGLLAKQVAEGAPFDVFVSADVGFVDRLVRDGLADAKTKAVYARGSLDLWWRKDATVAAPKSLSDLVDPRFKKIAMANPELAPYGKAAKEALVALKVWDKVQSRVVYGENIKQAMQFAQTGNAEVAFVAHALSVGTTEGAVLAVDGKLHAPIDQALVVCSRTTQPKVAQAFAAFLLGDQGRVLLTKHGLTPPAKP